MYLKSIEVQGFKSFANKIVFEFNNGITGIVGPNGSGKSNVADAVRWVLGEQSAKQLRGAKMEDVIFAGTQMRKPVGFAYVAITLDNSDHALPVEYDQVVISRRVFRSGESEYMINGNSCRLKDVSELFYDTGIGKEGYSIIGQGQIDKILSGKPEERRELFDEAAGIVKFKKRKAAAVKKLESEQANLVRVNDILAELEKQVSPLEKQSEKAREYLRLKEELKANDINSFLLEMESARVAIADLDSKIDIAGSDLEKANTEYESTKAEYEEAERKLDALQNSIEMAMSLKSNTDLDKGRLDGQMNVMNEQIKTIQNNETHHHERINVIHQECARLEAQKNTYQNDKTQLAKDLEAVKEQQSGSETLHQSITDEINSLTEQIEAAQKEMYEILDEKTNIKTENQRYETMLEQINIRKAELNAKVIQGKSEEALQNDVIKELSSDEASIQQEIDSISNDIKKYEEAIAGQREHIANLTSDIDKTQQQYHREKSRLESLKNIAERYDGYGNSIRKVMEQKSENPGIIGVVADIIKVQKQYEVAIETALGGTIQNIVTDNENTAKQLISYLKENKFGRATFLPLSSVSGKNTLEKEACLGEPGVVGIASRLVRVSFEYEKLVNYLLGRILVVDNIDNALAIAKKYKYSLRIVTLEGEQCNPGGSMTGGAFKNSSNLLGRRREIEELKTAVSQTGEQLDSLKSELAAARKTLASTREQNENASKLLREKQLLFNTAQLNCKQALEKLNEITASCRETTEEIEKLDSQITEIKSGLGTVNENLARLDDKNSAAQAMTAKLNSQLEDVRSREAAHIARSENIHVQYNSMLQKETFIQENITRLEWDIENLQNEEKTLNEQLVLTSEEISAKEKAIAGIKSAIEAADAQITDCEARIAGLKEERSETAEKNKAFFEKREQLAKTISTLDKECYRLSASKEKLEAAKESLIDYMWTEYEITFSAAVSMRNPEMSDLSAMKKDITRLRTHIKALGDVNVNAIEEYKEVSERYEFLRGQHDDLVKAKESLMTVIDELDNGMRIQFKTKFDEIKSEFDNVFRELFGGGRGTIELVEGEDILEAGILIISQPPGKKLQNMMQLSGGEKALTAISLLFAIQNLKPSPFCLLDEIEAALDDSNVDRYASYLHKLTKHTQFIVITHRRGTMAAADRLYGITMQEKGVSTLVSVDLIENELEDSDTDS